MWDPFPGPIKTALHSDPELAGIGPYLERMRDAAWTKEEWAAVCRPSYLPWR